jgi:hypothetical protein
MDMAGLADRWNATDYVCAGARSVQLQVERCDPIRDHGFSRAG